MLLVLTDAATLTSKQTPEGNSTATTNGDAVANKKPISLVGTATNIIAANILKVCLMIYIYGCDELWSSSVEECCLQYCDMLFINYVG